MLIKKSLESLFEYKQYIIDVAMESQDFYKRLMEAQDLMIREKYKDALILLDELKQIEKNGDFDYELVHKLYQLSSNASSFYNQQIILEKLTFLLEAKNRRSIDIQELGKCLREEKGLDLEVNILKRELELLILRDLASFRMEGNKLIL